MGKQGLNIKRKKYDLFSLEKRWLRVDMIEVFITAMGYKN